MTVKKKLGIQILHLLLWASPSSSAQSVDFEKEIFPIFEESCVDCHGEDKQKGALRIDRRVSLLKGGDTGFAAVVPGQPAKSQMLHFIKGEDSDERMPPKGSMLSKEEISLIEKWIEEGAIWPGQMDEVAVVTTDHWSFQPIDHAAFSMKGYSVDGFINSELERLGVVANPRADMKSLIRRASVVLTGLPPSVDRVERFVRDSQSDAQGAYESLIDELLASPQFGERWAQHWLDAIRWGETNGSESNLYRKGAWTYRDYVVNSFNQDLPYHEFIIQQLAGDRHGVGEATGFLVAGPHVPAATVGREPTAIRQARADRMDEILQTVGSSVMGLTISCARCHNHKFDPISIQDYYAMSAVFQGVEFGGRPPELREEDPRQKRSKEIQSEIIEERAILEKSGLSWREDWGGFHEYHYKPMVTRAVRLDFLRPAVFIDEMEFFGDENKGVNIAAAKNGTILKTDPEMINGGGKVELANDGQYGTMMWKSKAPDGSEQKPWVEFHFSSPVSLNRFRISNNREYYFETDFLKKMGGSPPDFRLSILQDDGSWKQVSHSKHAQARLLASEELKSAHQRLEVLIARLEKEGARHAFIGRFIEPVSTRVLFRGSPENPKDEVGPRGLEVLGGDLGVEADAPESLRRQKFAEWLIRPENPLTSRVMVNRIWHHLFGSGLVTTGGDFGVAGALPSHPALLDWLAHEFVERGWSMKELIKLMVMSDAFQRSSLPQSRGLEVDAASAFLWRFPPRRVEAEVIRDSILKASGKLDSSIGGPSYRIHNVKETYAQWEVVDNSSDQTWRRMLYQERMRRVDDQIFTAFDFPDCGQVRAKRPVSTTPLQSLNLLNSPFVMSQSRYIAERAMTEAGGEIEKAVPRVFELLLARQPSSEELQLCLQMSREKGLYLICRSLINSNEFAFLP